MLSKDDISQIGKAIGENNKAIRNDFAQLIEGNITPQFEVINISLNDVEERLAMVERKLNRVLYDQLDQHEKWIHQLAAKVGLKLGRE